MEVLAEVVFTIPLFWCIFLSMCIIGTYATHTHTYISFVYVYIYVYIYMMYIYVYIYVCMISTYIYIMYDICVYTCNSKLCTMIHLDWPWFPIKHVCFFPGRIMLYPYCIYIYIDIIFFMLGGKIARVVMLICELSCLGWCGAGL